MTEKPGAPYRFWHSDGPGAVRPARSTRATGPSAGLERGGQVGFDPGAPLGVEQVFAQQRKP